MACSDIDIGAGICPRPYPNLRPRVSERIAGIYAHKSSLSVQPVESALWPAHDIDAGDIVLVQGSKGSKVSVVVDVLRKMGQGSAATEGTV